MADLEIPNDIVAGTEIVAGEMQANFDAVESFVNTEVAHRDGSTPFTNLPSSTDTADPTTSGQLVTKAALDRRAGTIAKKIHSSVSLFFLNTQTDVGISLPSFQMPLLTGGKGLQLELYIPQLEIFEANGGFPEIGRLIEARLKTAGDNTLLYGSTMVGALGGFVPTSVAPIYATNYFYDNTMVSSGATVDLTLKASITGSTGKGQFIGSAGAPIILVAKMV